LNLKSNIITRLFSKSEIAHLQKEVENRSDLIKYIVRILESRWVDTIPREKDFDKNNYEFRRAFLDGRSNEITWWIKFLENSNEEKK